MSHLNQLEHAILGTGLTGSGVVLPKLLSQVPILKIASREFTGVGFFTTFEELEDESKMDVNDFEVSDIDGNTPNLKYGFGCVLFIRRGQIATVECFTYDEPWPAALGSFEVSVPAVDERNFDGFLT